MIFQEPMTSLNPVFTVGDQVMEAIMLHQGVSRAEARERTIELFREVGIPDPEQRVDSYPHQMSGGQKQRVMIAMALSCNPKLLIADEPTTALDVTIQAQILDILRRLRDERGMSILFITHDLGVIAEIADDVAVMFRGKLVEYGDVEQIFGAPKHPYTKGPAGLPPAAGHEVPAPAHRLDLHVVEPGRRASPEHRGEAGRSAARSRPSRRRARDKMLAPTGEPLLQVKDLQVHFPIRRASSAARSARQGGRRDQLRRLSAARRWASSANRAAARPRPAARSCG